MDTIVADKHLHSLTHVFMWMFFCCCLFQYFHKIIKFYTMDTKTDIHLHRLTQVFMYIVCIFYFNLFTQKSKFYTMDTMAANIHAYTYTGFHLHVFFLFQSFHKTSKFTLWTQWQQTYIYIHTQVFMHMVKPFVFFISIFSQNIKVVHYIYGHNGSSLHLYTYTGFQAHGLYFVLSCFKRPVADTSPDCSMSRDIWPCIDVCWRRWKRLTCTWRQTSCPKWNEQPCIYASFPKTQASTTLSHSRPRTHQPQPLNITSDLYS